MHPDRVLGARPRPALTSGCRCPLLLNKSWSGPIKSAQRQASSLPPRCCHPPGSQVAPWCDPSSTDGEISVRASHLLRLMFPRAGTSLCSDPLKAPQMAALPLQLSAQNPSQGSSPPHPHQPLLLLPTKRTPARVTPAFVQSLRKLCACPRLQLCLHSPDGLLPYLFVLEDRTHRTGFGQLNPTCHQSL